MSVVEGQHAVVVAVLRLDGGRSGREVAAGAELAELGHRVPVPGVHVGRVQHLQVFVGLVLEMKISGKLHFHETDVFFKILVFLRKTKRFGNFLFTLLKFLELFSTKVILSQIFVRSN